MNIDVDRPDGSPDFAEPVPDQDLDWTWPAADTFTDDSIARRTVQTCSELGSQRIRLIKIRAGRSDDVVECDSKVCFVSEAGEYTALSYTWGCPVERCHVIVDSQPRLVTVNLWRFLWQARQLLGRLSGWLWIDALSIEQSDPWEKLKQVGLISTIFGGAHCVTVWLGPAYGNSDKAMKVLATQKKKPPPWKVSRSVWASPIGPAMLEMCERPYWHRLWVYQEMRTSQAINVLCGSQQVSFELFKSLLQYVDADARIQAKVRALQDSPAAKMVSLIDNSTDTCLRSMLDATRHLQCTDPRDRVYAILNLVGSGHKHIEADYTKRLPDLVNLVLRNMYDIAKPLGAVSIATQSDALEDVFEMDRGSIYPTAKIASAPLSHPLIRLCEATSNGTDVRLKRRTDLILEEIHTWCRRYEHRVIAHEVYGELAARGFLKNLSGYCLFFDRQEWAMGRRSPLYLVHLGLYSVQEQDRAIRAHLNWMCQHHKPEWAAIRKFCRKSSDLLESLKSM